MAERADYVHRLLAHFEAHRWTAAPRFLGVDDEGREVLSYLEGHVAWEEEQPDGVGSDECLQVVGRLVREFHDLTAGASLAEGAEVVCHNDLAPRNTVYRSAGDLLRPVAFIDWDSAAPGKRIHDVAHACWQYVGLGPRYADVADAARRVRLLCDAYGLDDRRDVVETILWWQDRCWRGIDAKADAGDEAMSYLRARGAVSDVRACYDWVAEHRTVFEAAMK
ncbi:MAG TPA: phosphotransferase [Actinomycetota bacterium]|nr:phosphotransferase [Actinomycetota bacterium]